MQPPPRNKTVRVFSGTYTLQRAYTILSPSPQPSSGSPGATPPPDPTPPPLPSTQMPLAVRCNAFGPPDSLTVEDLDPETPGPDDVVLQVLTCGEPSPGLALAADHCRCG